MQSRVLYDGAVSRLSSVAYDGLGLTTITLASADLSTDLLNGALLFLARPGYNGDRHMEAVVVDTTANTIVVEDLASDLSKVRWTGEKAELCGAGSYTVAVPIAGFVPSRGFTGASLRSVSLRSIFAFNDSKQANAPTYQTHGRPKGANPQNACHFAGRTSAPSYASSQTTFTDVDADDNGGGFASWMIGSILVPDVNIGAPLIITGATATTLTVAGDARGVAANGSQYIVYAAPFTDPTHGAWQTDLHRRGTRYLWAGYRYQPPQMGFWVDPPGAPALGVYGAATGANRLGQYYCWNRTYDINTGRWTTPDPVATPWWNLYFDTQLYSSRTQAQHGYFSNGGAKVCGPDATSWLAAELQRAQFYVNALSLYVLRQRKDKTTESNWNLQILIGVGLHAQYKNWEHLEDWQDGSGRNIDLQGCATSGCRKTFTICGKCVSWAAIGNIVYGVASARTGTSWEMTLFGAKVAKFVASPFAGWSDIPSEDTNAYKFGIATNMNMYFVTDVEELRRVLCRRMDEAESKGEEITEPNHRSCQPCPWTLSNVPTLFGKELLQSAIDIHKDGREKDFLQKVHGQMFK